MAAPDHSDEPVVPDGPATHAHRRRRSRMPAEWHTDGDKYDYIPLSLPPDVTRVTASMRLALQAEFGGWELTRVRKYSDGTRKVLLRRPKWRGPLGPDEQPHKDGHDR